MLKTLDLGGRSVLGARTPLACCSRRRRGKFRRCAAAIGLPPWPFSWCGSHAPRIFQGELAINNALEARKSGARTQAAAGAELGKVAADGRVARRRRVDLAVHLHLLRGASQDVQRAQKQLDSAGQWADRPL